MEATPGKQGKKGHNKGKKALIQPAHHLSVTCSSWNKRIVSLRNYNKAALQMSPYRSQPQPQPPHRHAPPAKAAPHRALGGPPRPHRGPPPVRATLGTGGGGDGQVSISQPAQEGDGRLPPPPLGEEGAAPQLRKTTETGDNTHTSDCQLENRKHCNKEPQKCWSDWAQTEELSSRLAPNSGGGGGNLAVISKGPLQGDSSGEVTSPGVEPKASGEALAAQVERLKQTLRSTRALYDEASRYNHNRISELETLLSGKYAAEVEAAKKLEALEAALEAGREARAQLEARLAQQAEENGRLRAAAEQTQRDMELQRRRSQEERPQLLQALSRATRVLHDKEKLLASVMDKLAALEEQQLRRQERPKARPLWRRVLGPLAELEESLPSISK